ncbi:MAG: hypothetical protein QOD93_3810 [Acetobacteraceae bacterium]|nr:hypothetical protein [Acetobacteraceae bacterium]
MVKLLEGELNRCAAVVRVPTAGRCQLHVCSFSLHFQLGRRTRATGNDMGQILLPWRIAGSAVCDSVSSGSVEPR